MSAPAKIAAALGGGAALALGWTGVLSLFTAKDDPYGLGIVFAVLGIGGSILGAALAASAVARAVRERGAVPLARTCAGAAACLFAPLLGWSGALAMAAVSATPGSVFMFWALAAGAAGFLAPIPAAAFALRRAPPRGWILALAAAPGAALALLFAAYNGFRLDDLPTVLPVVLGAASAIALPVLLALASRFRGRPRRLVVGLVIWFFGTAALVGAMLLVWIGCELVTGLTHFRL